MYAKNLIIVMRKKEEEEEEGEKILSIMTHLFVSFFVRPHLCNLYCIKMSMFLQTNNSQNKGYIVPFLSSKIT
jgi:hypothetical protein